jgi:hypothetical protein
MGGSMSSVIISGDTSGAITLAAPSVAGTNTITLPAQTGTILVGGPAFGAYKSGSNQTTATGWNKVSFQTEEFDTANCFDSTTNYRFTPTVAGYYQCSATTGLTSATSGEFLIAIYKNGSEWKRGVDNNSSTWGITVSSLISFNGSTDYIEVYVYTGSISIIQATQASTWFAAAMVRSA